MDALSEALSAVRVTGAIFYHAECTAPWGFRVPPMWQTAHLMAPRTARLLGYHLLTKGEALVRFAGQADVQLTAGDIVIIPHGDAHTISYGAPQTLFDTGITFEQFLAGDLTTMRLGGGGETAKFVCGYFGCERHADKLFLAGLPRVIKINIRGDPAGQWLESSVRHLVSEAGSGRPGQTALLSRMAEALFIETLRRYAEQLPPEQTGWLAGARDPLVGAALAALHRKPERRWTLDDLAAQVGSSRSVVAERFARLLGEPPLTYLARWRMQLAARKMETTRNTVLQVALDVGYESEAAFNRAFKREFGLPPAQYRRKASRPESAGPRIRRISSKDGSRAESYAVLAKMLKSGTPPNGKKDLAMKAAAQKKGR